MYFLNAVKEQSELNIGKAKAILDLYNLKKEEIKDVTKSQYAVNILDTIFSYPFFSSSQFAEKSGIAQPYSNQVIKKLENANIVRLLRKGKGNKPSIYFVSDLIAITG